MYQNALANPKKSSAVCGTLTGNSPRRGGIDLHSAQLNISDARTLLNMCEAPITVTGLKAQCINSLWRMTAHYKINQ
jgi:hypothetical protein